MELRRYAAIVQRAWWLVLGVPLLVLLVSLPMLRPDPERYRVVAKVVVTEADPAAPDSALPAFDTYNSWQSSQYVIDDLPVIIRTRRFAEAVAAQAQRTQSLALDPGMIQGTFDVEREHRILSIIVNAPSAETALAIANASVAVLQADPLQFWQRSSPGGLAVGVLDVPETAGALSRWPQPITRLALRLMLGVVAGLGLAFLRHYLDRTVRERADLAQLGVPLLVSIPKE